MPSQVIPLRAVPSQRLAVSLANQACRVELKQLSTGLFFDLYVNDAAVVLGVLCLNKTRLVNSSYTSFVGDFLFVDEQGSDDPVYTGLNGRFKFVYTQQD